MIRTLLQPSTPRFSLYDLALIQVRHVATAGLRHHRPMQTDLALPLARFSTG